MSEQCHGGKRDEERCQGSAVSLQYGNQGQRHVISGYDSGEAVRAILTHPRPLVAGRLWRYWYLIFL